MEDELKIKSVNNLTLPIKYVVGLIIVILFLLVGGYFYYNDLRNTLDENYKSSIKILAETRNRRIEDWYSDWVNHLNTIANDPSINSFVSLKRDDPSYKILRDNIETQLKNYLGENQFGALEVMNEDGRVVYSAGIKLDNNIVKIESGISEFKNLASVESNYFIIENGIDIRLVVITSIILDNNKVGSIYAEIPTAAAFGSHLNNILIKSGSELDIFYRIGMNIFSLRKRFYESLNQNLTEIPEEVVQIGDLIRLNNNEGLISFKDEKFHNQYAYVVINKNTGWSIVARDKNKEKYSYLIEDLSSYLLYGLAFLLIASVLVMILWQKILELYSTAVKSDYTILDLQARFDHFSKFSHDIFFLLTQNGNIVDFNEKAFKTYGYTIDEFRELNIRDLRINKDRTKTDNYFKSSEKSKGFIFDTIHRRKDKSQFEVEVSMKEVYLNGKAYIQSIVRDISERMRAETKLKENEKVFELIANNLDDVVYVSKLKPQKQFEFISPSIEKLTGYPPKAFYEDSNLILKLLHPDDRYRIQQMMEGNLDENRPPAKFLTKNGNVKWVFHRSLQRRNLLNEVTGYIGIIKDVTAQINSVTQLHETENSFRYLFENNPLPMWFYDYSLKKFTNVNTAATAKYGYSKEEFLALKYNQIEINNKNENYDEFNIEQNINGSTKEQIHKLKDGRLINVLISSHFVKINNSENKAGLEVIQDITDRKLIEKRIQESEQRFKTLAKISPVSIFRANSKGELTYVNENWTEMTGVFPEIAFGRKWWEGLPIIDKKSAELEWKRSLEISSSFETEYHFAHSKSKVKWVLAGVVKITSNENQLMGFVGTLTDITRMKMFEGNFRKLYYSVEQSPISVVITDLKGDIEYVNPAAIKNSGYDKEELLKNNTRIWNSGKQNKQFYKNLWDTISSGDIWIGEFENKKKDGSYFWEHASISPVFGERGEITNYVAVKEDVTEKKYIYDVLLKAKNDALKSDLIKTNFLKKINHELRTPLSGVIGCANAVYDEAESVRIKELGKILISESAKLNESLKSILSFSSIETEQKNYKIKPVEITTIAKNVFSKYLITAHNKNIQFVIKDLNDKTYVDGNTEMVSEIISHIIDNAIKFTDKGGVTIYNKFSDNKYILSIKDTGKGIQDNIKDIIFEPFSQVEEDKKNSSGIGLGLTLAKKYSEILGGKLWFESEVGKGTTFHLALKLANQAEEVLQFKTLAAPIKATNVKNGLNKLLIVEDDEINLAITKNYLKNLFDISVAVNSIIALEQVAKNKFDIILMDIGLKHGLSGIELTKLLRNMPEYKTIPIIAVTAFTLAKDKDDIMDAGCSDYLAKPFAKEDLLKKITDAFS